SHLISRLSHLLLSFLLHDTATSDIYSLSLHDALPIFEDATGPRAPRGPMAGCLLGHQHGVLGTLGRELHGQPDAGPGHRPGRLEDRKSTRLNSSHVKISYAVFCLKKKKNSSQTSYRTK